MLNVWKMSYASPFKIHVLKYKVYVRFLQFNQQLGDFLSIMSINVANDHKWCVCVCVHAQIHTSGSKYGASSYWNTKWQKDRGTLSGHYSDPCSLSCTIIPHLSTSLYLLFNLTNLLLCWISLCQSSCRNMKKEFIAWQSLNIIYWNSLAEPRFSSASQST